MEDRPDLIITHDGVFHADEVIAIALVEHYFCSRIPISRTRDESLLEKSKLDPKVWLIDVGMELEPKLGNLDHHHDRDLLGATIHVAEKLWGKVPDKFNRLVTTVSEWDVNAKNIHENTQRGGCISQFFKSLNNHGSFEDALQFARKLLLALTEDNGFGTFSVADGYIVDGLEDKWKAMLAAEELMEKEWERMYQECKTYPVRTGEVIILPQFFPWARFAKAANERMEAQQAPVTAMIIGAIFHDERAGNWRLSSIDSKKFPISEHVKNIDGFVFIHPARFIAGFDNVEAAKKAAELW